MSVVYWLITYDASSSHSSPSSSLLYLACVPSVLALSCMAACCMCLLWLSVMTYLNKGSFLLLYNVVQD